MSATKAIKTALNPSDFTAFKLASIRKLNYNTSIFSFKLEDDQTSGMFVASCILTKAPPKKEGDSPTFRPYTPITNETTKGHMDLMIKKYPNGTMSSHIFDLAVGDELFIKGPIQKIKIDTNMKKEIGMIAGGTGITPMLQVIHKITEDPEDKTMINLLFANTTEEDVLLREHLDSIAGKYPENFKVHYIVSRPSESWTGLTGRTSAELITKYLPSPSLGNDAMIFVCGPPGMVESVSGPKKSPTEQGELTGILSQLGFTADNVFKF